MVNSVPFPQPTIQPGQWVRALTQQEVMVYEQNEKDCMKVCYLIRLATQTEVSAEEATQVFITLFK